MDEDIVIPLGIFGGFFLLIAFNTLTKTCGRVVCHWRDVTLKIRMVDEGFRPDEIAQVFNADRAGEKQPRHAHKPPVRQPTLAKQIHA